MKYSKILICLLILSLATLDAVCAEERETRVQLMEIVQKRTVIGQKKDNLVLAPVPLSDQIIGTGLTGVLMNIHPPKDNA